MNKFGYALFEHYRSIFVFMFEHYNLIINFLVMCESLEQFGIIVLSVPTVLFIILNGNY